MIKKLLFFVSFFVFLSPKTLAASYNAQEDFGAVLYDNYCTSLSSVLTIPVDGAGYYGVIQSMPANNCGAAWVIDSPIPIISGRTYSLSMPVGILDQTSSIQLSKNNRIGLGTTFSDAVSSYINNINFDIIYSSSTGFSVQYVFKAKINADSILIPFSTGTSLTDVTFTLDNISIDDMGSDGVSESDINNSLNNQTNEINSSIQNSTNIITDSITDVEDSINNSINDNFNSCRESYNLFNLTLNSQTINGITFTNNGDNTFNIHGTATSNTTFNLQNTYSILKPNFDYYFYSSVPYNVDSFNTYVYFTTSSGNAFLQAGQIFKPSSFTDSGVRIYLRNGVTVNYDNVKFMIAQSSTKLDYEAPGEICTNKIDETNDKLNDLNNNITNDNVSGVEESFSRFEDFLDNNSTITQLITLPVTLYSSILQGVSNSCTPFNLGSLYGKNLILPCVNIGNYLGSTLWGMIDLIISGFAIYSISKKLIKVFNNFSSMKDGDVIDD